MNKLNDLFDQFVYINCSHRKDRNKHIQRELLRYNFDQNKVYRLEASYYPNNGAKGCSHSHYRIMKLAIEKNWNNVFVIEDDFAFDDFTKSVEKIKYTMEKYKEWDVIMPYFALNGLHKRSKLIDEFIRIPTHKKYRAFTTSCYCVNRKMFNFLKDNFYESFKILPENRENFNTTNKVPVDRNWQKLQLKYNWYLIYPKCGHPIESKSDISVE